MEEEDDINLNSSPGPVQKKTFRSLTSQPKQRPFREYAQASNNKSFYNTGYGGSKYDKGFSFDADFNENDPLGSINEHRANEQSGWTQLGALPFRATAKAATEVAKLAPIIYGVGKAIFEDNETSALEDIFNNEGIKALDEMNQKINTELLPVYVKDSVKNGTLMDNLLSTSFYATEGADGIGFMASMFAPGMILSKLSLGSKLIGGLSKVSKLTKMVEGTEGSVQVLKGLGWSARAIDSKIAVLTNSMIEAGAESKGTQDALNSERLNEIELYKSKGLSQEQAEEVFNQKHPDWDNQVASAMKGDFWMQMPMLLGTGSMMHKAIFGKALDKVEKTVEYGLKGRIGSIAKQWGKATLSEGFIEEAGQSTLENYYTKKAYEGKLGKGLIGDVNIGDLTKEYINTVSSVEGQKAIFLGALMGGPFMSMEARKEHLKGLKDTNSITNGVKSSIDDYNTIKENDIYEKDPNDSTKPLFKRDENGNITNEKVVNREKALKVAESLKNIEDDDALYDEAIKSDDIELQKFIQNRNILKLIAPAIQNGKLGLQILKEELEQTLKFTDISEADKSSKDENNTNKKLVENILEKAKHLQEQNEKFKDFSPDIIKLEDPRTTKELNEEYLNHLNSKYIETKSLQYDAENNLKELNKKRDNILDELGLDKGLQIENELSVIKERSSSLLKQVSDKIRETEKEVSKYKKDINELWENKDLINKSFKSYINDKEKKQKQTSEENVKKTDDVTNLLNEKLSETDEFGENELTQEDYEALLNNEVLSEETKSVINDGEEIQRTPNSKKENTKKVEDPRIKELNKKIFLLENLNKKVILNGNIKGTLVKINDERYELHDDNFIHEININDIDSFKLDTSDSKYNINNITEDSVTVNGVEYIINTDSKGNIVSLSPVNKPSQEIKNEKLITAVEIKRNQLEYTENIENIEEVIEKLENNYSNLNAILDTIWETNMTNTVAEALDNLYEDKTLTKSEELQLSLWLIDAFKRVTRLYNEKNTKEETETLNQAYSNLETIESLLYNLKINKNETVQKERSDSKNEIIISSEKTKTKSSETNNEEIELLKKEKENLIKQLEEEKAENIRKNRIISEETEAAIRELHKEKVEQLPTQAEKETKRDLNRSEQEGVDEKDITEDDSLYKEEDENVANSFTNSKEVIKPEPENNSLGHKIQNKITEALEKIYKIFEKTPRDKREDKVTFSLGDLKYITGQPTLLDIFTNVKNGKKLITSEIEFLKQHQEWLENYLPIKVTLTNGKEEGSSFLKSKKGSPNFESYELPLRRAIIKALIENKGDFTKFEGSVQGQGKGKLNLDNASTQNNVLDISVLKGMKKPELLKYLKENTYIVNHDKQLVHAGTGQKAVESFFNVIKSFHSGDVFLVFTRPNGQKVPIKLNNKRISEEKAGATVKLLSLLSNVIRTNQSDTILSDKDFKTFLKEKIGEETYNQLESEINLSKKNNNNERLREILEYVTYSQNNNEISKLYIDNQGNLTVGRLLQKVNEDLQGENNEFDKNLTAIGFTGFAGQNIDALINDSLDENEQARFNHLVNFIRYKKSNIIADKFKDNNYVEHVFGIDNKESLVSTNVSVDKDMFEGYSDIFLNNEVTTLEDNKTKAKELKEIENTEIPLTKEVVYNEPNVEIKENENNSENTRIIENNFVSLSKLDNITNIRDKQTLLTFAKEQMDFKVAKGNEFSIKKQFEQLKQEFSNDKDLNEEVKKICGL